jgi:hypothetical protein
MRGSNDPPDNLRSSVAVLILVILSIVAEATIWEPGGVALCFLLTAVVIVGCWKE